MSIRIKNVESLNNTYELNLEYLQWKNFIVRFRVKTCYKHHKEPVPFFI